MYGKTNPFYKNAASMKLYLQERVEQVEKTRDFIILKDKYDKRLEASKKAVISKKNQTQSIIDEAIEKIYVPIFPIDEIRNSIIKSKKDAYISKCEPFDENRIDEKTLSRWMVNYIRHELTNYEQDLYDIKGRTGAVEEYYRYKDAVLEKIADAYPSLTDACFEQMEKCIHHICFISAKM